MSQEGALRRQLDTYGNIITACWQSCTTLQGAWRTPRVPEAQGKHFVLARIQAQNKSEESLGDGVWERGNTRLGGRGPRSIPRVQCCDYCC